MPSIGPGGGTLPVTALQPGPFQPRIAFDPEALAALAASIQQQGILQPLLVRPHPQDESLYQIIAGERRWRAAQAVGLHDIPVLIRSLTDADAMAAALVENLQRDDLNAIEEAEGYRRLVEEFALTQEQLGAAVGKSRSHIANTLRLLQLPASVRSHVEAGTLTAGHARALLSHPEPETAARIVVARGLNVRQTEAFVARPPEPKPAIRHRIASHPDDPDTLVLARQLSQHLGLRVDITFDGRGGSVRIQYQTLDQLDGVIALLQHKEESS
ncbi:MAG: ParB/RepB/Spo0J family partition protein [Pseudomonadota bacterium]|nr:ParB/RepB/Spo0J family partition protein [Pseudomonadota bacterium]